MHLSLLSEFLSRRNVSRRKVLIATTIAGVLAFGSLFALTRDKKPKSTVTTVYELAPADVLTVQERPLTRTLRLTGSLTPLRHGVVKAHSDGALLEMHVREGDRVRKNQLLCRIDPRNLIAELDARTAALHKAEADLSLASKNRDNSVVLLDRKLISQNAFDQTQSAYDVAAANTEAAAAQVRLAENALHDTEIRADFDGVVATRYVQVGERVMPDTPLLALVDLSTMELEALVPVADVPTIKPGQEARFTVDGFGAREFTGQVERINPQTQQGTRSLTVYVSVNNADGALKGGMFADGELVLQQTAPLLAVPKSAIHRDANESYVLLLQNGEIVKRAVIVGDEFASTNMSEIREGLAAASRVIVTPIAELKPGVRAKLIAPALSNAS